MTVNERNQNSILNLFYQLPSNLLAIFSGYNLAWLGLACLLTYVSVVSGFDWAYFKFFRNTVIYPISFSAAVIGGLAPILVPLVIYLTGLIRKKSQMANLGLSLGQAALLGWLLSSFIKAFTGRVPPSMSAVNLVDITHRFQFGLLHGGIFWGWPSSHTTTAFATAVAMIGLFPDKKWVKYVSLIYAFYIGLLVAVSIHWFSDFIAGAILGTLIGLVVGKSFYSRGLSLTSK